VYTLGDLGGRHPINISPTSTSRGLVGRSPDTVVLRPPSPEHGTSPTTRILFRLEPFSTEEDWPPRIPKMILGVTPR